MEAKKMTYFEMAVALNVNKIFKFKFKSDQIFNIFKSRRCTAKTVKIFIFEIGAQL